MFKSGFIAILGRPNVGKSTFFNSVIGDKLSIVADKPQTTRNRISGIKNYPEAQMIFLDTPGLHEPKTPLNRAMTQAAKDTIGDADILLLLVEATSLIGPHEIFLLKALSTSKAPVFLAINKTDKLNDKTALLPLVAQYNQVHDFKGIFPISALTGQGLPDLLAELQKELPEGPKLFPDDMATEASERFIAGEFIREQIMILTQQEVPYSSAVTIEAFKEDEAKNLIHINATIHVAKDSQKIIMIGKKGALLKKIGTRSRIAMEKLFGAKVFLELFVRVKKDWPSSENMLREFGILR